MLPSVLWAGFAELLDFQAPPCSAHHQHVLPLQRGRKNPGVAQGKGENYISKSDSKRESKHPGNLSPVQEVAMMLPTLWLCLNVVTAVTPMSHQLQGAEFH